MKKQILITGGTDGIGKLLAEKFANEGHHLYLHGRNADKLETAIETMKSSSRNDNIFGFIADFSNLDSVKNMAEQVMEVAPQLDILINNAGIFKTATPLNPDGLDVRLVVNYLAPYVLTSALLPTSKKGQQLRIINLSSAAQAPVSLNALQGKNTLSANEAYAQSKLALTMWSFNLAKQLSESDTTVIAVNPGSLLNTKMVAEAYGQHWTSADKGVNILYDLALSDEYAGVTGKYFDNDKGEVKGVFASAHADAYDENKIQALLAVTETLLS